MSHVVTCIPRPWRGLGAAALAALLWPLFVPACGDSGGTGGSGGSGGSGGAATCAESCSHDAHCTGQLVAHECVAGRCQQKNYTCTADADCQTTAVNFGQTPDCVAGYCAILCSADSDCTGRAFGSIPFCLTTLSVCVPCVDDTHCIGKPLTRCIDYFCAGCAGDSECVDGLSLCLANGSCGCRDAAECVAANAGDACVDGVCSCSDTQQCIKTKEFTGTTWVCE